MIIAFAYFYTNITFNPLEIANNMKRSGGFIPGIRPGKPTSDYLNQILNYIVFIGAIGLAFIAFVPIFLMEYSTQMYPLVELQSSSLSELLLRH